MRPPPEVTPPLHPLALAALVLALAVVLAGDPPGVGASALDVRALADEVERERDHVTALQLAQWIRERRVQVIDVRDSAAFAAYHVPGAERRSLRELAQERFLTDRPLVLYSEGGAHAAQAWVLLRARGYRDVFFLRGGLYDWITRVMEPTLAPDATEAERAAFAEAAALSRYFGGMPRTGVPRDAPDTESAPAPSVVAEARAAAQATRRIQRRGC